MARAFISDAEMAQLEAQEAAPAKPKAFLTDEEMARLDAGATSPAPELAPVAAPATATDSLIGRVASALGSEQGFRQAMQPTPIQFKESALDTFTTNASPALGNALKGAGTVAYDIARHPIDTFNSFGDTIRGGINKILPDAVKLPGLGPMATNDERIARADETFNAFTGARGMDPGKATGENWEQAARTVFENPLTPAMDVGIVAGPGMRGIAKPRRLVRPATTAAQVPAPKVTPAEVAQSLNPRNAVAGALDRTAAGLAESAIKPSKARGKLKRASTAVDEFLAQPGAELSRGYLDELGKLIETVDGEKTAFFTELKKSGKPINTVPVAKVFAPIDKAIAEAGPEGMAGFVRARGNLESLLAEHVTRDAKGNPVVPADAVQNAKMRLSSDLRTTAYGTEKGPLTEGIKATVRGAKDAVADSYPEFQTINAREARLLTLQEALAPAVGRAESRNPIGLGTYGAAGAAGVAGAMSGGLAAVPAAIGGGFLAHQLENPAALGRNAKRIKALANKVRPQAPQAPVAAAPAPAIPEGTFPPIDARNRPTRGLLPETTLETVTPEVVEPGARRLLRSAPYTVDSRGRTIPPEYAQRRAAELKNAPVEDAEIITDTPRALLNPGVWGKGDTGVFPGPGMELPPPGGETLTPTPAPRKLIRRNPVLTEAAADAAKRVEGAPVGAVEGSSVRTGTRPVRGGIREGATGPGAGGVGEGLPAEKGNARGAGAVDAGGVVRVKPKPTSKIEVLPKRLNSTAPDDVIDFLLEKIGEDAPVSIGLRGIYKEEIGKKKLRQSSIWEDGKRLGEEKGKSLGGTSTLSVAGDWQYETRENIVRNLKRSLNNIKQYGNADRIAIVVGRHLPDVITEDVGESVLSDARVIGYIERGTGEASGYSLLKPLLGKPGNPKTKARK